MSEDHRRVDRRRFFREGLRHLIKGVADSVESVQDAMSASMRAIDAADLGTPHANAGHACVLRPPGALPEKDFRNTCSRCGDCVRVCPVQCIKLDVSGERGHGVSYIDADTAACALCESLACMHVCPTGALVPTPLVEIKMGTAVWREETCIRSRGEECRICVEKCPMGSAAIDIINNDVIVNPHGCAGCGQCQHYCPTSPKSIVVIPKAARE
jgi:ferredoxin-type protein NapG